MSPIDTTDAANEDFLSRLNAHQDLCTTCNEAEQCLGRATLIRPVLYCESFDCYVPVEVATAGAIAPTRRTSPVAEPENTARGICSNCEERGLCAPSLRGDTVWFCEEYV